MPDHGLDGGAATQLAFDETKDATLLAGDEDAAWVCGFMAAVALVKGCEVERATASITRRANLAKGAETMVFALILLPTQRRRL